MNYYSRNSPVKRKINNFAGFLTLNPDLSSALRHQRKKLRSKFIISSESSYQHSQQHQHQQSRQILILDDDYLYITSNDQIFIQQEILNQTQIQQKQEDTCLVSVQNDKYQKQLTIKPIQKKQANLPKHQGNLKIKTFNNISQIRHQNICQQNLQKTIIRNYSFGKSQQTQNNFDKVVQKQINEGPLIKKIVNIEIPKKKQQKKQKQTQQKQRKHSFRSIRSKQQNWDRIVQSFIRKRQKSQTIFRQQNQKEITNKVFLGQKAQYQILKVKAKDEQERQSNETGQFQPIYEQKLSKKEISKNLFDFERVKKSFREQDQYNFNQPKLQLQKNEQIQKKGQKLNSIQILQQNNEGKKFAKSTQLLESTMKELPPQFVSIYKMIYEQLVRKQNQSQIITRRMQETQEMMRLLIQADRKQIFVDHYLLEQFQSPVQQRICVNMEIIMSLVRKLSQYF